MPDLKIFWTQQLLYQTMMVCVCVSVGVCVFVCVCLCVVDGLCVCVASISWLEAFQDRFRTNCFRGKNSLQGGTDGCLWAIAGRGPSWTQLITSDNHCLYPEKNQTGLLFLFHRFPKCSWSWQFSFWGQLVNFFKRRHPGLPLAFWITWVIFLTNSKWDFKVSIKKKEECKQ